MAWETWTTNLLRAQEELSRSGGAGERRPRFLVWSERVSAYGSIAVWKSGHNRPPLFDPALRHSISPPSSSLHRSISAQLCALNFQPGDTIVCAPVGGAYWFRPEGYARGGMPRMVRWPR